MYLSNQRQKDKELQQIMRMKPRITEKKEYQKHKKKTVK